MVICLSILEMPSLQHNVVPKIGDVISYVGKWRDGWGDSFFQTVSFIYDDEKKWKKKNMLLKGTNCRKSQDEFLKREGR